MIPKAKSFFPLTVRQVVLGSIVLSNLLLLIALIVSPANLTHPVWILAFYFCGYGTARAVTDDFLSAKNPALVYHSVFGFVQVLAGAAIAISSYVIGRENQSQLWSLVAIGFWVAGAWNFKQVNRRWQDETLRRKQAKLIAEQEMEATAQRARESVARLNQILKDKDEEETLMADLTAYLADADQAGNGRSDA